MARNKALFDLVMKISADSAELKRNLNRANSQMQGFAKTAKKAMSVFGGLFAGREVLQFGKEISDLNKRAQGVENAFKKLNTGSLLSELRAATKGTVSDFELMRKSVQAKDFNINLESMPKLLKFASVQAQRTGEDVNYLVNSIIDGLGRQSTMILDNLGLSAKEINDEFKQTGDFVGAVTSIIDKKLKESGDVVEDTATKAARFNASLENAKETAGGLVNEVLNGFYDVATAIIGTTKEHTKAVRAEKDEFDRLAGKLLTTNENTEERTQLIETLQKKYPDFLKNISAEKVTTEELLQAIKDVNGEYQKRLQYAGLQDEAARAQRNLEGTKQQYEEAKARAERSVMELYELTGLEPKKNEGLLNYFKRLKEAGEDLDDSGFMGLFTNTQRWETEIRVLGFLEEQLERAEQATEQTKKKTEDFKKVLDNLYGADTSSPADQSSGKSKGEAFAEYDAANALLSKQEKEADFYRSYMDSVKSQGDELVDEILQQNENISNAVKFSLSFTPETEAEIVESADNVLDQIKEKTEAAAREMAENRAQIINEFANVAASGFETIGAAIGGAFTDSEKAIEGFANMALTAIQRVINALLSQAIAAMIAGESVKGLPGLITAAVGVAALKAMFNNNIDSFADGGVSEGGFAIVGERGRELVHLPTGSHVYNTRETEGMLKGGTLDGEVKFEIEGDKLVGILRRKNKESSYF